LRGRLICPKQASQPFDCRSEPFAARFGIQHAIASKRLKRILNDRIVQRTIAIEPPIRQKALDPIRDCAIIAATLLLCAQDFSKLDNLISTFHQTMTRQGSS
jgi:hypothetical protein